MSRNGFLSLLFHAVFIIFSMAPIVIVCLVAFTPTGYLSVPVTSFSLRWFAALFERGDFLGSALTSLWLGLAASTIALILSVPAALAIFRYRFYGREAFLSLLQSPLMIPHVVLGIAFLRFFSQIGLTGTFAGLVIAHVIVVIPFTMRMVLSNAGSLDASVESAAESLGAGPLTTFRRITLPMLVPGLAAGWLLAFITSFDELTMTTFIASPQTVTLPVRMFNYIQDNIDPLVAAVSAALIGVAVLVMVILDRLFGLDRLLVGGEQKGSS